MEVQRPNERQIELMQMIADGSKQAEIAVKWDISVRTIQTMVKEIRSEFGLKGRESVCVFFHKNGWIK